MRLGVIYSCLSDRWVEKKACVVVKIPELIFNDDVTTFVAIKLVI